MKKNYKALNINERNFKAINWMIWKAKFLEKLGLNAFVKEYHIVINPDVLDKVIEHNRFLEFLRERDIDVNTIDLTDVPERLEREFIHCPRTDYLLHWSFNPKSKDANLLNTWLKLMAKNKLVARGLMTDEEGEPYIFISFYNLKQNIEIRRNSWSTSEGFTFVEYNDIKFKTAS